MTNRKIEYWVIPPEADGEFVAHMEEVLEVYERPYNPAFPVLCMDEHPVQLLKETRSPIPATAKHGKRVDYEYERAGTASIFMFAEPLAGWREVAVRERKTKIDWATEMARLLEGRYAGCAKGRSLYPKGRRTQTMASPQAVAAFRVQALERSRFAVGRLPAAYGDWSARRLGCRCEVNGVKWPWNSLAELTTRPVSAPRPAIAVALDDRAAVGTRDFPSSPPMGDSFWLGL